MGKAIYSVSNMRGKKKTCEPGALQDTGGFNRMQCLCTRECDPVLESKDIWDKKMVFSVEEQPVLLIAEASLQPQSFVFFF